MNSFPRGILVSIGLMDDDEFGCCDQHHSIIPFEPRSSIIASASIVSISPDAGGWRLAARVTRKCQGSNCCTPGRPFLKLHPILGLLGINGAQDLLGGRQLQGRNIMLGPNSHVTLKRTLVT